MRKRARLIYNPVSGRELMVDHLAEILNIYENAGYETSAFQTTAEEDSALNEARRVVKEGLDLLIIAGGDGTIYEVLNGISDLDDLPLLAVLPAGTANDFANAHGLSDNIIQAAKAIENGETVPTDIGKMTLADGKVRYFSNIAAMGNMTELTYEVSARQKSIFGYFAYVTKGAELLPQSQLKEMTIDYEGGSFEGKVSMVFVALTSVIAGFEGIVPDSRPGDGKFTLIIVKSTNVVAVLRILNQIRRGDPYEPNPNLIYAKTDFVKIKPAGETEVKINLDGEYGGNAPAEFENLRRHVQVVANPSQMNLSQDQLEKASDKLEADILDQIDEALDDPK